MMYVTKQYHGSHITLTSKVALEPCYMYPPPPLMDKFANLYERERERDVHYFGEIFELKVTS